jgi:hypothetical protein
VVIQQSVPGASSDPQNGIYNWDIGQTHIPRYSMAVAVKQLRDFNNLARDGFSPEDRVVTTDSDKVGIYSRGPNSYDVKLLETSSGWPAEFVSQVEEDVRILEECQSQIESEDDVFYLSNLKTPAGFSVASESKSFIEAIAFENSILGKLDATQVGAFGAYCVWRDLITEKGLPRNYFEQLVENQFEYDAEDFKESPFLDLAMDVQEALLDRPIWGVVDEEVIQIEAAEAVEVLLDGMGKLNGYQLTQFYLMDQLHQAGLFLPIAQVIGMIPWEQYVSWKTQGYQPDSYEEQSLREETAFIKMIGDLADES